MMHSISNSLMRVYAITTKEIKQLSRDRITFAMVIMIPLIQLLLFGYAINTDVRQIPVAIVDQSDSAAGRWIVEAVKVTQVVDVTMHLTTAKQAQEAIRRGDIKAALILPPTLTQKIAHNEPIGQWVVDGSDTMIAGAIKQLQNLSLNDVLPEPTSSQSLFEVSLFYNPEQRSAVNIVPGLIAVILTMTMVLFTSSAIVRERERGNLELLITTPIKSLELMIGKILPYIVIGLVQMVIILGLGHVIFAVPIDGTISHLLIATLLFITASLTLGLIISTIAQTQLQAMQMTIFILLPTILLSGFITPLEAMPNAAQWIAEMLPGTHFMRVIRAIVLKGATLMELIDDIIWLIGFTLIGLGVAAKRFNKRLD
ncbi:transport permease protein [Shewanella algicola]|uniref:Transport permease protein n=1 Tax=Shewanella algicola TaxID=640633 RepID=A0A9X1Z3G6_9GAMM|nr:ABC transporter permease [Shewanella algicola]MCL1105016.1 ABC transporter permease [Shewanella algicola]GGP47948.1 transport permease protein [Shewanella algicola]